MEKDKWLDDLLFSLKIVLKSYPLHVFLRKILESKGIERGVVYDVFYDLREGNEIDRDSFNKYFTRRAPKTKQGLVDLMKALGYEIQDRETIIALLIWKIQRNETQSSSGLEES